MSFKRETLEDGAVRLSSERCSFTYQRPRPGVVFILIVGNDKGEFGTSPMDELREDIRRYAPVELFFEMDEDTGANLPVQEAWTEWFSTNRSALKSVSILTHSKYMHFTAEVVKLFSRTGELIRVYLDPEPFQEALQRAAPGAQKAQK
ncbi:STAS/SEC14 domain-containing protein [Archangium violaceum]|uniref:STAS/SEC14 domain-containing protein n=1 Tax=Archangium violaceum TaxID=83451 RepID=UPI00193B8C99|nr:STAS/SEC14 domain-containing protein [Archangium violaceum]QRK10620.1 STAS/SEC14 domain-containing protein [Archangium violaceum]